MSAHLTRSPHRPEAHLQCREVGAQAFFPAFLSARLPFTTGCTGKS